MPTTVQLTAELATQYLQAANIPTSMDQVERLIQDSELPLDSD